MSGVERIIDANQNRCVEGLRVIEEYCRFIKEDREISSEIRSLRHFMRKKLGQRWITHRDSGSDVGKTVSNSNTLDKKIGLAQILRANSSRVAESMRVIEEYLKVLNYYELSKEIESKRFEFYEIEKRVMANYQVKGLYALTSDGTQNQILAQVQMFIDHEVPWIQYRDKNRSEEEILKIAREIVALVKGSKSRLIINDYPEIAMKVGAHGVHVGQGDQGVEKVRQLAPELLVGISTHNIDQFDLAVSRMPDYIALGPIFATKTKMNPEACEGISFAEYARRSTTIPLVAIGGIDATNIDQIKSLGMDALAMTASIKEAKELQVIQSKYKS